MFYYKTKSYISKQLKDGCNHCVHEILKFPKTNDEEECNMSSGSVSLLASCVFLLGNVFLKIGIFSAIIWKGCDKFSEQRQKGIR